MPYWLAFQELNRARPVVGGMVMIPRPIPAETIRADGERRGYVGDGLAIFVMIVSAVADWWLETEMKRLDADARKRVADRRSR